MPGDPRSNENIHLTSLHLLFARQHNLLATRLAEVNQHWSDEKLFQESRKILSALLQHITYKEFLPVVLGQGLMEQLNMSTSFSGYSRGYDSSVDATIANSFAASAFRFGHSLLPVSKDSVSQDHFHASSAFLRYRNIFSVVKSENQMKNPKTTYSESK